MRLALFLCSFLPLVAFAGIYRHDVKVKKYKELANQHQFNCVGKLIQKKGDGGGSCVLIGKKYVLSAAHCFIEYESKDTTYVENGRKVTAYFAVKDSVGDVSNYLFVFNGKKYGGKRLVLHPNYRDSATKGECDLAIIELENEVEGVEPAVIHTLPDEVGKVGIGVGYGVSGIASKPETVKPKSLKIAGENLLDSIGGFDVAGVPIHVYADFDHPTDSLSCNKMGIGKACAFEYMPSGGDSGGGLFVESSQGQYELVGVCTGLGTNIEQLFKTGYYGQMASWTRVAVFSKWIGENTTER